MAFLPVLPTLTHATSRTPLICSRRQLLLASTVKTRRRRRRPTAQPTQKSLSSDQALSQHAITTPPSSLSMPTISESDLPDELTSHSLLTAAQEHDLLTQVQFLHRFEETRVAISRDNGNPPSEAVVAAALSMSVDEVAQQRQAALQARNFLVTANVRLVSTIASKVHRYVVSRGRQTSSALGETIGISRADLVQEGCIALIRAAERYDGRPGVRFTTYAARAIWSACNRVAVPASCIVTLPDRLRRAARRSPVDDTSATQIKSAEHVPNHLVQLVRQHLTSGVSLDDTVHPTDRDDRLVTRGDMLTCPRLQPNQVIEQNSVSAEIRTACYNVLFQREADIMVLRFGLNGQPPLSPKDIGALYGITSTRVNQLVAFARHSLKEKAPYLEQLLYEL